MKKDFLEDTELREPCCNLTRAARGDGVGGVVAVHGGRAAGRDVALRLVDNGQKDGVAAHRVLEGAHAGSVELPAEGGAVFRRRTLEQCEAAPSVGSASEHGEGWFLEALCRVEQ